ncbi:MAG: 30S ribosomal protein S1 [Deltaproteobacteria bacterium]|nr:30S ribosomal protein S1 [Deltaproteobacteria bacterium]
MTQNSKSNDSALSFEQMLEQSDRQISQGQLINGKIIEIRKKEEKVIVDIGYKSEGEISLSEFEEVDGSFNYKVGDEIEVFVEELQSRDDMVQLSKEKADKMKVWDEISSALDKESEIEGVVKQKVKGGLSVLIRGGVKAFLPGSQVDLRPVQNLDQFVGKTYRFKIIKFNKKRGNIVLSRRAILEKERDEQKANTLSILKEGEVVEGTVKNVTDYGAFIDLGGVDGLLHITDMSWGRVTNPKELIRVNDKINVKILKYDPDSEKVSLGIKQITEDPWISAQERYKPGTVVRGKVVSLKDYGAFVELEEGIEGLIHVSEMSWTKHVKHPSQMVEKGDIVEAAVLDIDTENARISLGMKQLEPNPYDVLREKYPVGCRVSGKVRNIADFGIFIEIEEGIDGLVHISDLSWTQKVRHPSELFTKGDDVDVVVLNIDIEQEKPKISLGIKQLVADPWSRIPSQYAVGTVVKGHILKVLDFGAFIELEEGVDGLVHISEISEDHIEDPKEVLNPGDEVDVAVIGLDPEERRISLSIKAARRVEQLSNMQGGAAGPKSTLGDVFGQKLQDALKKGDE